MIIAMCDVSHPQVKAVKKRPIRPELSYEEGMRQDVDQVVELVRSNIRRKLICVSSSFQRPVHSKAEYLEKIIKSLLMECKKQKRGGNGE